MTKALLSALSKIREKSGLVGGVAVAVRGEEALWEVGVLLACPETCKHKICSELWGENGLF